MALSPQMRNKVDVYAKHYSMIPLEIGHNKDPYGMWDVFYIIRSMEVRSHPLYMKLASCRSKQLAVVKLSEIEDYVVGYKQDQSDKIRQQRSKEDDLYWYMIKSIHNALDTCQSEIEFTDFLIALSAELQQQSGVKIQGMIL